MSTAWRKEAIAAVAESRKNKAGAKIAMDKPKSGSMVVDKCISNCTKQPAGNGRKGPVVTLIQ